MGSNVVSISIVPEKKGPSDIIRDPARFSLQSSPTRLIFKGPPSRSDSIETGVVIVLTF